MGDGILKNTPLSRSRVPQDLPENEFELFEAAEGGRVFKLPAASRNTPAGHKLRISAAGGQVTGVPFLLIRFLWASKKMNINFVFMPNR